MAHQEHEDMHDFHSSLEPVVIINDGHSNIGVKDHNSTALSISPASSNLSIAKRNNRQRSAIKIRIFEKEYSPSKDDTKVQSKPHERQHIRIVTQSEAESANETYNRRKTLPLQKCPVCKKFFRRMNTHLLKHEITTRDPGDNLACTVCSKMFNNQSNLQIHMRTHTGDKPYVCDVCQKGFSQSCNLVNHVRIHTGEKPFKCPHCERAFTQSGNLNNHIRLHTAEKPFQCHFCDKAFVQSGNLNSHVRNNHKVQASVQELCVKEEPREELSLCLVP